MGYSLKPGKGILLSMVYTGFKCPKCECKHTEDDYLQQLGRSENGFIYKKCKGCKETLGITQDIKGDVHVWLKKDESKIIK